jgi:hypothetical protein
MTSHRFIRFAVFFLCILSITGCDAASEYADKVFSFFGLEEEPVGKDGKTKKLLKEDLKKGSKKTQTQANKKSKKAGQDIVVTHEDKSGTKKLKDKDLKKAKTKEFSVEAPVEVTRRVGGSARYIKSDKKFIYMDFPQHFAVYDKDLKLLANKALSSPLIDMVRFEQGKRTLLYLKEESNILEILELVKKEHTYELKEVNSFEVDGNFYWIHPDLLVVFLKDKLQFLNFTDLENIKIIHEAPIRDVKDAYLLNKKLYLSRNGFLDILDLDKFSVTSTLRIGRKFEFLGIVEKKNNKHLLLSYIDKNKHLKGLQLLTLNKDLSGIQDFGKNIILEHKLRNVSVDLGNLLILGQETDTPSPVHIYSIKHERFLRGALSRETNLLSWYLFQNQVFLVQKKGFSISKILLDEKVIDQSKNLSKFVKGQGKNVPLAHIGAAKTVKDEYEILPFKNLEFMANSRKVVLLDKNHFVVFEQSLDGKSHRVFASNDFSQDKASLKEPLLPTPTKFSKLLPTNFGLLAYSQKTRKTYLLDVEFNEFQTLPIKNIDLISWQQFSNNGEFLVTTGIEQKINKKTEYAVNFYHLTSPKEIKLFSKIIYKEKPFIIHIPDNQILIVTKNKMDLYLWDKLLEKKALPKSKLIEETVDISGLKINFKDIKISPANDMLYSLYTKSGRNQIFVLSLLDIKKFTTIADIDITRDQFAGSSFSKQGRLFILPTQEGTLFYDMTNLSNVREVAHWPLPSEYVDLADQGQFICVALGYKGVYCGKLLF